ncbi:MAG: RNA methyltransferase [Oscillospiraceae bacterium]|jgi:TrmH family RNA methyltransferase|nr:RNA methyltransferase [Oscillospiraceae bacterium]
MKYIKSAANDNIKYAAKIARDKRFRRSEGLFLAEGRRLCMEAAQYSAGIRQSFVSEESAGKFSAELVTLQAKSAELYLVPEHVLKKISDEENPQGFITLCKTLDNSFSADKIDSNGKYTALENISDPGNVGTIMRAAEAFGISALVLCGNCADIYSPKAARSCMGAIFRLPVYFAESAEAIAVFKKLGVKCWAAALSGEALPLSQTRLSSPAAVFIGSEAHGLMRETAAACDASVMIDMPGRAESLNAAVAASILMWEMRG